MKYLILGANAAGMSAAVRIQKSDRSAQITVLEKSDVVSFGACGIPYFVAGEFPDIERMTARTVEEFRQTGIDIQCFHQAIEVDPKQKVVTAQNLHTEEKIAFPFDKLLIATGASPNMPPITGLEAKNLYTMHSRYDAQAIVDRLPQSQNVVIIGGGFIGVEAAEAFKERGKNVTLIEFAPRILEKTFDAEITPMLEAELRQKGVNLRTKERVIEIEQDTNGHVCAVHTDQGRYAADLVILATGFKPNTEFLQGIVAMTPQGAIIIDELCQTDQKDIYAAGDCATVRHRIAGDHYLPLATTANKLGRLVGSTMAGNPQPFIGTLGSSGIRAFDLEAGRTGIGEEEAKALGIDYKTVFIKDKNRTDYVLPQTDIWVKLIYDAKTRVLLGGQICGSYLGGAVHRVDALAVAIYSGLTVDELGFMDFIYAPPFARTWDVLNIAGNVAK